MRFIQTLGIGVMSWLLLGGMGAAQYRSYPQNQGNYGYRGDLIDRVMSDLSMASEQNPYMDSHERDHFRIAQRELQNFQQRSVNGQFDTGALDRAIESLEHLANADQLSPQDRSVLSSDLAALRNFRANGGGAYSRGGYGRNRGRSGRYGSYGSSGTYGGYGSGAVVERVLSDLNYAQSSNPGMDRHERDHFRTAQQELQNFQYRWQQGQFDTGALDRAISSISHLAGADQLSPRDRSVMSNDLAALRDFRANRSGGGGYNPYPYR